MASIGKDKNGYKRILFVAPDEKRKTIRLGKESLKAAETIRYRVECLLSAAIVGCLDRDTAVWVASLDETNPKLRRKLEAVGLLEAKVTKSIPTLEKHLADFMERNRGRVKPGTVAVWEQVIADLKRHLTPSILISEITTGHAKAFLEAIKQRGMQPTTIRKRIGFARQFLQDAVDFEVIPRNPFDKIKTPSVAGQSNVTVSRETIAKVMKACDPTWQTIVALSRYGGLRCPSEVISIKWEDIDWERSRLMIPEPKCEHHAGRGIRECPIFPELRPYLDRAWELAPDGAEYVIDKPAYRRAANTGTGWKNANLRTQFLKKLAKAKVEPWPRLFHSMRASRQTELEREFPLHVVCAWLGNSEQVAKKHYLMVAEDDFLRASQYNREAEGGTESGTVHPENGTQSGTANDMQTTASYRNKPMKTLAKTKKASENTGFQSGGQGIRTSANFPGKSRDFSKAAHREGLGFVVDAWEHLTDQQREAILLIVANTPTPTS